MIVSKTRDKPTHCSRCRDHLVPKHQTTEISQNMHEPLATFYRVCPVRLSEGDKSHDLWVLRPYDILWALHLGENK